jgi:hypothetical protein
MRPRFGYTSQRRDQGYRGMAMLRKRTYQDVPEFFAAKAAVSESLYWRCYATPTRKRFIAILAALVLN